MRFDESYLEDTILADGTTLRFRLVRPDDKALFQAAWGRVSPESRYRRFLSPKSSLTAEELRYLTEPDNVDHVAIGVARVTGDAPESLEAVGVARFVRDATRPTLAEAAIVVVDDMQRKGIGRMLLSRLGLAALERGITHFSADVLATNTAMRELAHSVAPEAVENSTGDTIEVTMRLPPEEAPAAQSPLYRLLGLVARGMLRLRPW